VTILAKLDSHADQTPDAPAVDGVTYAQLRTATLRVATQLRRAGIAPGDRIVLYAENSHAFVYAYLGALRAGAVVVPANVLYREGDLARVIDDSGAIAVAVSKQSRPFAAATTPVMLLDLEQIALWAADASLEIDAFRLPNPDRLALLIYTSGTTGRAKGAMLTHGNLVAIAEQLTSAWRWTSSDTLLLALPLFHIHGLGAGLNGTIFSGARLLLRERFDALEVARALRAGEATMFFGVPTMYVRFLEGESNAGFDRVRLFVSGSAALPASVHEAFAQRFGASILER